MGRVSTRHTSSGSKQAQVGVDSAVQPASTPPVELKVTGRTRARGRSPTSPIASTNHENVDVDEFPREGDSGSSDFEVAVHDENGSGSESDSRSEGDEDSTIRSRKPPVKAFTRDQKAAIAEMIRNARGKERGQLKRRYHPPKRNARPDRFSPPPKRYQRKESRRGRVSHLTDSSEDEGEASLDDPATSDDSSLNSSKPKKWDKRKRAPPPTLYWIGQGKEPSKTGRLAGSREKFSDRRHKAKEQLEGLGRICKGQMATMRHAQSHLLLGFQLRETRRLLREVEDLMSHERHQREKDRHEAAWETDEKLGHLTAALQVGIDACRHEVAIAGIHSIHGEGVVQGVEGEEPKDPRYELRTDYVIKQLKKDKVDEAVIRGKPILPPIATAPVKQNGPRLPTKRSKYRLRWSRDHQPSHGALAQTKPQRNSTTFMRCYNCGTPGHLTKECPKRKASK